MPLFASPKPSLAYGSTPNFDFTFNLPNNMGSQSRPAQAGSSNGQPAPTSIFGSLSENKDNEELQRHVALLGMSETSSAAKQDNNSRLEEARNAPLFTRGVKSSIKTQIIDVGQRGIANIDIFPQYALIGHRKPPSTSLSGEDKFKADRDIIYANMNAPWSAFICGSQGAGKSHTFSCLLENALLSPNAGGVLPDPLTGIVFHYDKFTSHSSTQLCEAAYLCSVGIPVQVLVSPSNVHAMRSLYSNLPGLPEDAPRPQVRPLKFHENHLNVGNMKTLMAVDVDDASPPLYLAVLDKILRDMARDRAGRPGFDYRDFTKRLCGAGFTDAQLGPLKLRLQLLEEFLDQSKPTPGYKSVFDHGKGSLTIIDLSCPFVAENDACALFGLCLSLFLERRNTGGRIIALDEAHKFLTQSGEAQTFTEQLISIIRQQRHLASRVVISTQEPTLSPQLLELCNVTFVHRFRSPRWLDALKKHIAGAANCKNADEGSLEDMFKIIVGLRTGEALVFSPDSLLDIVNASVGIWDTSLTLDPLLDRYVKVRIRNRISADGGKSIMASDTTEIPTLAAASEYPVHIDMTDESVINKVVRRGPQQTSQQATQQATPISKPQVTRPDPCRQLSSSTGPSANQPKTPVAKKQRRHRTAEDIEQELMRQTRRILSLEPNDLNFSHVRRCVEDELGIEDGWLSSGASGWKSASNGVIKDTVLAWFISMGKARPPYARDW